MRFVFSAAIAAAALWAVSASAASTKENVVLGLVTGPATGTYIAIGRDIARIGQEAGVQVDVKESEGSIDNIKRINSRENAALGIVQSDVLGFLSRSRNPETVKIASRLRLALPLYREEVHVLARRSIGSFKDLNGKRVVIGEEGSGHMLTAVNLLSMMNIKVAETLKMAPPEGVVAVLQGEADAIIFVGGKPVKLFKNMESLSSSDQNRYAPLLEKVHFLALAEPRMLEEYQVAEISAQDYGFVKERIPTIAVTAALVTYDFSVVKNQERCNALKSLSNAVRKHIGELKTSGHPKWQEVDLNADLGFWKKDRCSLPDNSQNQADTVADKKDLLAVIGRSGSAEKTQEKPTSPDQKK